MMTLLNYLFATADGLRHLPKGWKPDVIHVHVGYPAGVAALAASLFWRTPIVYTEYTGPLTLLLATRRSRLTVRFLVRRTKIAAAISHFMSEDMKVHGIAPRAEVVVPIATDPGIFRRPNGFRREHPDGSVRLLTVSHLIEGKGLDVALETVKVLVQRGWPMVFTIVGIGPLRRRLEDQVQALGLREVVRFAGRLDTAALAREMWNSDVFLSTSFRETFGVVVVEAMVAGTPVVATRSGGADETVLPTAGILVPPGDVLAIAGAVETIMKNPSSYSDARTATETFGTEAISKRLDATYRLATAGCAS